MSSRVVALSDYRGTPRLGAAVEAFFSAKQLSANTRRAYRQALSTVVEDLGMDLRVDQLDSRDVLQIFQQRWGSAQPATWNTRITAVQSFVSYCQRNQVDRPQPDDNGGPAAGTPRPDQNHPLPRPGNALVTTKHQPARQNLVGDAVRDSRPGRGNPRARHRGPGPSLQASSGHRQEGVNCQG